MDLQARQMIARLFPKADHDRDYCKARKPEPSVEPPFWICTRPKGHDGFHVRHVIAKYDGGGVLPMIWSNPPAQAQD